MPLASSTRRRKPPERVSQQVPGPVGQPQPFEHFVLPAFQLGPRQAVEMSLMADVFGDRQFFVEAGGLKDDADVAADFLLVVVEIESQDFDPADLQRDQGRQQAEEGGLAAAVGAEKGEDFARGDRQRQVGEGLPLAVPVAQLRNVDRGGSGHRQSGAKRGRSGWRDDREPSRKRASEKGTGAILLRGLAELGTVPVVFGIGSKARFSASAVRSLVPCPARCREPSSVRAWP